jgi:hypothetical protein
LLRAGPVSLFQLEFKKLAVGEQYNYIIIQHLGIGMHIIILFLRITKHEWLFQLAEVILKRVGRLSHAKLQSGEQGWNKKRSVKNIWVTKIKYSDQKILLHEFYFRWTNSVSGRRLVPPWWSSDSEWALRIHPNRVITFPSQWAHVRYKIEISDMTINDIYIFFKQNTMFVKKK